MSGVTVLKPAFGNSKQGHRFAKAFEHLEALLHASEKRASEAERTFADLRNLIAVNLAANAELVRERDEARRLGGISDALWCSALAERDEARTALGKAEAVVDAARKLAAGGQLCGENWAALRTALTHTGNDG